MEIKTVEHQGITFGGVSIVGNFTINEVESLRSNVKVYYDKGIYNFRFDFSECLFMNSNGWGILVFINKYFFELEVASWSFWEYYFYWFV